MTTATDDRTTTQRGRRSVVGQVATGSILFALCLLCYNAGGYVVDATDATAQTFAGVADSGVDNSDGVNGDEQVRVLVDGHFRFAAQNLTRDDVGKRLYLIDNQTVGLVDDASVDHHIYVGRLAEYISANEAWVAIDPRAPEVQQYTVRIAGTNAAPLDLSALAAQFGGAGFVVDAVQSVIAFVTAGGASAGLKALATNYTVANGVITTVTNESANTLVITFTGRLS